MTLLLLPVCKDKSVISLFTEIHGDGMAGSEQDYKPGGSSASQQKKKGHEDTGD
jgi:hypothetical protein